VLFIDSEDTADAVNADKKNHADPENAKTYPHRVSERALSRVQVMDRQVIRVNTTLVIG